MPKSAEGGASASSASSSDGSNKAPSPIWIGLKKLPQQLSFKPEDCLLSDLGMKQTAFKKSRQQHEMSWDGGKGPDVIYCSPMRRCILTAVRGFCAFPTAKIIIVPELREKHKPSASIEDIKAWLRAKATEELFGVPINMNRISFSSETKSDHSQYGVEGRCETQLEIHARRDKFITMLKKEFQKKPIQRVALSFHGGMMQDFIFRNGRLIDKNGKLPEHFAGTARGFPHNFKPYWAQVNEVEKVPVMVPYPANKIHPSPPIMLLRHAESHENALTKTTRAEKRQEKKDARMQRKLDRFLAKRAKAESKDSVRKVKTLASKTSSAAAKVAARAVSPSATGSPRSPKAKAKPKTKAKRTKKK